MKLPEILTQGGKFSCKDNIQDLQIVENVFSPKATVTVVNNRQRITTKIHEI